MPTLQYPFTSGLSQTSMQAIQQIIRQNERRQLINAQAKAEGERLKTQSKRAIGGAIGGGIGQIAGAFAQRSLNKQEQNQFDLKNFGMSTEALDNAADSQRSLMLEQPFLGELAQDKQIPDQETFRFGYRQQLFQERQQQQAQREQQAKASAAQQKQVQKAATEQRIQAWLPDPKLDYESGIVEEMAQVRKQLREDILDPEPGLSQAEQQESVRHGEHRLSQLRQMGTKKQEFNIKKHLELYSLEVPGKGVWEINPKTLEPNWKADRAKSGDGADKDLENAMKVSRDDLWTIHPKGDFTEEDVQRRAFQMLDSKRVVGESFTREAQRRNVIQQRQEAQTRRRQPAVPLSAQDRSQLDAFRSSISGGGAPKRPVRPGQPPIQQPPAQPQQQQTPPAHPALAKIAPENINQKAVDIVQKAGGTGPPVVLANLRQQGFSDKQIRAALKKGQIVIIKDDAYVWDGRQFVPMEKS